MEAFDLSLVRVDPGVAMKLMPALALRRLVLPLCVVKGTLHLAMARPDDESARQAVARAFPDCAVEVHAVDEEPLRRELLNIYGDARTRAAASSDDPVSTVDDLLRAATLGHASDIHLDPSRADLRVRFRVDGVLEDFQRFPSAMQAALVSRIKVMAGLDIAEKRAPQDGAIAWALPGVQPGARRLFDIRVATLPVRFGERVTLRLLESGRERATIDTLGMTPEQRAQIGAVLDRPHGLVLLSGPTGSGKTTTLYAAIHHLLASRPLNIITVEDPVEYEIDGVAQVEVESSDKVNFGKALRSILRHDPDVVMIGEIRDKESLDVAVKASLTGHLVLSTLHTNSAVSAVTRLRDMGLEPHLIGATLRLAAAQRLVRRLCPACRREVPLGEPLALALGDRALAGRPVFRPDGCVRCAGKGYDGRTGVFEFFANTGDLPSLIASGADEAALAARARALRVPSLRDDALAKVFSGVTTPEEALRVTAGEG